MLNITDAVEKAIFYELGKRFPQLDTCHRERLTFWLDGHVRDKITNEQGAWMNPMIEEQVARIPHAINALYQARPDLFEPSRRAA